MIVVLRVLGGDGLQMMELKPTMKIVSVVVGLLFVSSTYSLEAEQIAQDISISRERVPHPEWRSEEHPSFGAEHHGPVSFLWPVPKKNIKSDQQALSYDFVLSKNSDLSEPLIVKKQLEWAFVNTHSALPVGEYFWQYRVYRDGDLQRTSKLLRFTQGSKNLGFSTPDAEQLISAIGVSRPRVLATTKGISNLESLGEKAVKGYLAAAENYTGVELAKEQYGGEFTKNGKRVFKNKKFPVDHPKAQPTGRIFYKAISSLCKAYLLSGDEKFADEAQRWALHLAAFDIQDVRTHQDPAAFPEDDFDIAVLVPTLAIAYDSLRDRMSKKEREIVMEALEARTDRMYHYFRNRLEARVLDNHAWQHTYSDFLRASIALAGDSPMAEKYLRFAYGVWVARFPIQSITDGGWTNGKYVGVNFETWATVPLYFRRYAGVNYYEHPFFANNVNWLMSRFQPGSAADGFGGDGYEDELSISKGQVGWLNIMNAELKDPRINWYLKQWGQSDTRSQKHWLRTVEGLESDHPLAQSASQPDGFESTYLFRDIGKVSVIESWDPAEAGMTVAMRSAPWGAFSHNLSSLNAVNILFAGERLLYPTGYRHGGKLHAYEWYRHSRSHNTLLVNGKGQPVSTDAWGQLTQFLDAGELVFAQADASQAYSGTPSPQWLKRYTEAGSNWYEQMDDKSLQEFKRNLVVLKPGVVVIYDEVKTKSEAQLDWRFHSPRVISVSKQGASIQGAKGTAHLHFFGSDKLKLSVTDESLHKPFNVDGRKKSGKTAVYQDLGWHLNVQQMGTVSYLLTLVDVRENARQALEVVQSSAGEIRIGDIKVKANLDPKKPANLVVTTANGGVFTLDQGLAEFVK